MSGTIKIDTDKWLNSASVRGFSKGVKVKWVREDNKLEEAGIILSIQFYSQDADEEMKSVGMCMLNYIFLNPVFLYATVQISKIGPVVTHDVPLSLLKVAKEDTLKYSLENHCSEAAERSQRGREEEFNEDVRNVCLLMTTHMHRDFYTVDSAIKDLAEIKTKLRERMK